MNGNLLRKQKVVEDIAARCPYPQKVGTARCAVHMRPSRVRKTGDVAVAAPICGNGAQHEGAQHSCCSVGVVEESTAIEQSTVLRDESRAPIALAMGAQHVGAQHLCCSAD